MLGQSRNAPPAREFAASGAFSLVVAGVGFEPTWAEPTVLQTALLEPESHAPDQHVYAARRDTGTSPSAMRPCTRGSQGNSHGPRTGKRAATDGRGGSGYADRPPGFPALQPLRWRQDRWRGTAGYGASVCGRFPGAAYGIPISGPRCAGSGLLQSEPSLGGCVRTEAALPVLVATCVHWRSSSR
jgi:hypothetical protein